MGNISSITGLVNLWAETTGSSEICIAVLDGSVDMNHPCFTGAQLQQVDTLSYSHAKQGLASEHGTQVASIIWGQHGSDVQGIAPHCRGIIIPIYSSDHAANRTCSQLDLARAINQAISLGAHIINISGGELSSSGIASPILEKAIQQCIDSDILVIAAAGNDGCRCLHVPASIASVLAVGAMDNNGEPLAFSNWGDVYQKNGILALGVDIPGAVPGGMITSLSGTSFAAPIISGVAALLLSLQLKQGHEPSPQRIRSALLETADPCDAHHTNAKECERVLVGRLNITQAHTWLNTIYQTKSDVGIVELGFPIPEAIDFLHPVIPSINNSHQPQLAKSQKTAFTAPFGIHCSTYRRNNMNDSILIPQAAFVDSTDISASSAEYTTTSSASNSPASSAIQASEVVASDCGCQKGKTPPANAYVLGQIGYDFATESQRDAFTQLSGINIHDPHELLTYLKSNPSAASNMIWTLCMDATVVYAIQPYGPFANHSYDRLQEFLASQLSPNSVDRVSIPGLISGSTRLMNGQEIPVLFPDLRGMYSWSTAALISANIGPAPTDKKDALLHEKKSDGIRNFLDRIYYEVRNLGITPQDRAMNYAATNAFQVADVYSNAIQADMKLDVIDVERSPICRPGSDCWDVKITFFNPAKRLEQARHVYRFTIDVSEVIPVTVGKIRHWDVN
ncbi:PatA/PatG family cyanobactin maturation protease [Iodobacter arcticus]|uniref:PatA/PatG family cyanobactin maturation protease n=1 Tax=Iodobacter arcticus TaxID=590593 RepID=A0ABW2QW95_9NEIS